MIMKRKLTKILASLLCVVMIITAAPVSGFVGIEIPWLFDLFKIEASAVSYSGTCGDNLTWTLDTETGVLDITGTGDMTNWQNSSAPWYSYRIYIKSVNIGNSVTSIGDRAFYYHNSLTSVTIGKSVTSIGAYAFTYCGNLTSITIPDSVTSIGAYAFTVCDSLTKIEVDTNNKYYSNDEYGVLFNKDKKTLIQYPIGNTRAKYTIPDSVTGIGYNAFYSCGSLTDVTIGKSVTSIGAYVLAGCHNLTSVTIPESVTSIGKAAFRYCPNLTSITIPDSVTSISDDTFYNCKSLTSITIPDSVTSIGNAAFRYCNSLNSITIGNSVTSIGNEAFYWCDSLTSVVIPDSVTSIGDDAFAYCNSLTSVTIGNSVTSIGEDAFFDCDSLTSIIIPDSVTSIGHNAFYSCDSLTKIEVDTNNKYYSNDEYGVLFNKDKTTLIRYPIGNTETEYTIPDSVTNIGHSAFSNCNSLTDVTIGKSVTSIGAYTFGWCSSLTDVYYKGTQAQWNAIEIEGGNNFLLNATIHYNYDPDHTHSYISTVTKEPTCVEKGVRIYTCSCGDTYTEEIPVVDHTWGEWEVSAEDKYVEIKECSVCQAIQRVTHTRPEYVKVTIDDFVVKYKEPYKLTPKVEAGEGVEYEITYTSSNPEVVTVDKDGNVTTKGRGIATIYCTVTDEFGNEVKDTCGVVVKFNWWQWIIWILLWGWAWY